MTYVSIKTATRTELHIPIMSNHNRHRPKTSRVAITHQPRKKTYVLSDMFLLNNTTFIFLALNHLKTAPLFRWDIFLHTWTSHNAAAAGTCAFDIFRGASERECQSCRESLFSRLARIAFLTVKHG